MSMTDDMEVYMRYSLKVKKNLQITLHVKNEQGEAIFSCSGGNRCYPCEHEPGEYEQIMFFPANFFNWGTYALDVYIVEDREHSILRDYDVVTFTIANKAHEIGTFMGKEPGDITPQLEFIEKKLN
jgi:lipopolysaccharide transport system ATP-binding protein